MAHNRTLRGAENKHGHKPFHAYQLPHWVEHPLKAEPCGVALLFPDGTSFPGMCAEGFSLPSVQRMIEVASDVCGYDVKSMLQHGLPDDSLSFHSQTLTYVSNCVTYEIFKHRFPDNVPRCVAGLSIGEYSSLVAAGVMTFTQGLVVVQTLATEVAENLESIAIGGVPACSVQEMCEEAKLLDDEVHVAQQWSTDLVVCTGRPSAVARLHKTAQEAGAVKVSPLSPTVLHTPFGNQASQGVARVLSRIPLKPPSCQMHLGIGFKIGAGTDPDAFRPYLISHVTSCVKWDCVLRDLLGDGERLFYECGPGQTQKGFMSLAESAVLDDLPVVICLDP